MAIPSWIERGAQETAKKARAHGGDWRAIEAAVLKYLKSRGVSGDVASHLAHSAARASRDAASLHGNPTTGSGWGRGGTGGRGSGLPGTGQTTHGTPGGGTGTTTPITGSGGQGAGGAGGLGGGGGGGGGAGGTGTPPPKPDPFWSWLTSDPRWAIEHPGLEQNLGANFLNYGYVPAIAQADDLAHGIHKGDITGYQRVDPNNPKSAPVVDYTTNPYSVLAGLKKQLNQNSEDWINQANARGLLQSGALVGHQQGEENVYGQNLFDTQQKFDNAMQTLLHGESDWIWNSMYPEFLKTAPPSGNGSNTGNPPPTAPAPPPPTDPNHPQSGTVVDPNATPPQHPQVAPPTPPNQPPETHPQSPTPIPLTTQSLTSNAANPLTAHSLVTLGNTSLYRPPPTAQAPAPMTGTPVVPPKRRPYPGIPQPVVPRKPGFYPIGPRR